MRVKYCFKIEEKASSMINMEIYKYNYVFLLFSGLFILVQETLTDLSDWFATTADGNFTISGGITFVKEDTTLVCKLPSGMCVHLDSHSM